MLFGLLHGLGRGVISSALQRDAANENAIVQTLQLGYGVRNPPLYDWLLWLVQQLVGPNISSFMILNYSLILALGCFVYGAAKHVTESRRLAVLCSLSMSLMYQIGYAFHEWGTHSILLSTMVAGIFYATTRLINRQSQLNYIFFGLAMAGGLLSKFGFPLFLGAVIFALLLDSTSRQIVKNPRAGLSFLVALICVSPFLYWLIVNDNNIFAMASSNIIETQNASHLQRAMTGLWKLFLAFIALLIPFLPIVLISFPALLKARKKDLIGGSFDYVRLLGTIFITLLLMIAAGIAILGAQKMRLGYLLPVFLLIPVYVFSRLDDTLVSSRQAGTFLALILVVLFAFLGIRVGRSICPDLTCRSTWQVQPFSALATEIGISAKGSPLTLISNNCYISGNLRQFIPQASRVKCFSRSQFEIPPVTEDHDMCLAVLKGEDMSPSRLTNLTELLQIDGSDSELFPPLSVKAYTLPWRVFLPGPDKQSRWVVWHLPTQHPLCR